MSRYEWVYHENTKLFQVGILADGTLYNPNSYPEDTVRAAVLAADERKRMRRSKAAEKAAVTRQRRQMTKVHIAARCILAKRPIGPRSRCYICARPLSDRESIDRGIGSKCWQDVLNQIETEDEVNRR
jgi:hypothetical protein